MGKINSNWKVLVIIGIVLLIAFLGGWIILAINSELGTGILIISGGLLMGLSVFIGYYLFIKLIIKMILKNHKIWSKIFKLSLIIGIILMVIGGTVFFLGIPFENKYNVDEVMVLDVNGNELTIDYTNYNHGDKSVLNIKKPFFVKVKKEDLISVRYPIDNPSKMYYVINANVGIIMLVIGIILCSLWGVQWSILVPYTLIKYTKRRNKVYEKE